MLGGLRSAGIGLSMQYGDLNQPQTITAPTTLRPFSEFDSKLKALVAQIEGGVGGALGGGAGSSLGSGASGAGGVTGGAASSAALQAYSHCIQAAHSDVAKMQKCASLLNG